MTNELRFFKETGEVKYPYPVPPLHMPSLRDLDKMYKPYELIEVFVLRPHSFEEYRENMRLIEDEAVVLEQLVRQIPVEPEQQHSSEPRKKTTKKRKLTKIDGGKKTRRTTSV